MVVCVPIRKCTSETISVNLSLKILSCVFSAALFEFLQVYRLLDTMVSKMVSLFEDLKQ